MRIRIKIKQAGIIWWARLMLIVIGIGIMSTISISKTRNTTAKRKNRKENGRRAEFLGSNPHSKGEHFSRSSCLREARDQANVATTIAREAANKRQKMDRFIPWK